MSCWLFIFNFLYPPPGCLAVRAPTATGSWDRAMRRTGQSLRAARLPVLCLQSGSCVEEEDTRWLSQVCVCVCVSLSVCVCVCVCVCLRLSVCVICFCYHIIEAHFGGQMLHWSFIYSSFCDFREQRGIRVWTESQGPVGTRPHVRCLSSPPLSWPQPKDSQCGLWLGFHPFSNR